MSPPTVPTRLETEIGHLDQQRQSDIPTPQMIERARLDGIGGAGEKAVHQGMAAAVWPLDPPHLDDFLAGLAASQDIQQTQTARHQFGYCFLISYPTRAMSGRSCARHAPLVLPA